MHVHLLVRLLAGWLDSLLKVGGENCVKEEKVHFQVPAVQSRQSSGGIIVAEGGRAMQKAGDFTPCTKALEAVLSG